jgi:tetratricopeptide (TPR) repeat protein
MAIPPDVFLRHAEYYLSTLEQCDELYKQGDYGMRNALALFDDERANILLGQQRAEGLRYDSITACKQCNRYPDVAAPLLPLRLSLEDRLRWRHAALEAAQHLHDSTMESVHLVCLGNIHDEMGQPDAAITTYDRALVLKRYLGDREGEKTALANRAIALVRAGRSPDALETLQMLPESPLGFVVVDDLYPKNLHPEIDAVRGVVHIAMGDKVGAIRYLERALVLSRAQGDLLREGSVLIDLARVCFLNNDPKSAAGYLDRAIALSQDLGAQVMEGQALIHRGLMAITEGILDEALAWVNKGVKLLLATSTESPRSFIQGALAVVLQATGDFRRAAPLYESLLPLARAQTDRQVEIALLHGLSSSLAGLGEVRKSIDFREEADRLELEELLKEET